MIDTTNHCPLCQNYSKQLQSLEQDGDRLREFLEEFVGAWDCGCSFVSGDEPCMWCRARALHKQLEDRP